MTQILEKVCPILKKFLQDDTNLRRVSHYVFKQFDRSGNGEIDGPELYVALEKVGSLLKIQIPPQVAQQVINRADTDENGAIDEEEFYIICRKACELCGVREKQVREDDDNDPAAAFPAVGDSDDE